MARSMPGLLRLIVVVALAAFWLGVALLVALLAAWPEGLLMALVAVQAVTLAALLVLLGQARARTQYDDSRNWRSQVARPVPFRRLNDARTDGGVGQ
jgi:hypothetical protein